jgi:hypothetical protein
MTHKAVWTLVVLIVGTLALSATPAQAQVGPYYATPSWDQTLPCNTTANCPRFIVVMGGAAVLDRETGLVWEQTPTASSIVTWVSASLVCGGLNTGNRGGWKLPTLQELSSLLSQPGLPPGNPFVVSLGNIFWTSTTSLQDSTFAYGVSASGGRFGIQKISPQPIWCVRGGSGLDSQ